MTYRFQSYDADSQAEPRLFAVALFKWASQWLQERRHSPRLAAVPQRVRARPVAERRATARRRASRRH